jgi:hypothetical protein
VNGGLAMAQIVVQAPFSGDVQDGLQLVNTPVFLFN